MFGANMRRTKRGIQYLKGKPLKWWLVLFLIAGAGPFAADVVILFDLITLVGMDVFLLSLLLYFREALFGWISPWRAKIRASVESKGLLWPDRNWFASSQEFGRRLTYNLDLMEVQLRVVALAMLLSAAAVPIWGFATA